MDIEKENENLKRENKKIGEKVNNLKAEFKCDKCTFDTETMKVYINHMKNHTTKDHRERKEILCNKA